MTATPAYGHSYSSLGTSRARARGLERAVMRVAMAMLLWARRRADRQILSRDENMRRLTNQQQLAAREHSAAMRAARVR